MNVKNEIVFHKKYGCGTVCEQEPLRITVDFGAAHGMTEFAYPECFSGELTLCDPLAAMELNSELSRKSAVTADDGFDW